VSAGVTDTGAETLWTPEQVMRGRELAQAADQCPWELGDLALEVIPFREAGGRIEDQRAYGKAVRSFADEIGVEFRTLQGYRETATRYPAPTRVGAATWSAHRALSGNASDAPYRKAILEQLAVGKRPGQRVTDTDVRKHLGTASVRRNRRDKALDVVDRFDKVLVHLEKVAADPDPLPERARKAYEARLDRVERLAELWRDIATRTA
jgi:hypothetical protein